ncbi:MAG: capsid assembly protein [Alphaproteobacteria bacterium]
MTEQQENEIQQTENPVEETPPQSNDFVPEKFIKDGEVQVDQLAKSYTELEKKLSSRQNPEIDMGDYEFELEDATFTRNEDFDKMLMENGVTGKQAQLIYNYANEHFGESLQQKSVELAEQELSWHFGGDDKWNGIKKDIQSWASQNLDEKIFTELGSSVKGIKTLYNMMQSSREFPISDNAGATTSLNQDSLYAMMDNPKYWRDKDPEYIAKVQKGFKDLYGDEKVNV